MLFVCWNLVIYSSSSNKDQCCYYIASSNVTFAHVVVRIIITNAYVYIYSITNSDKAQICIIFLSLGSLDVKSTSSR